MAHSIQVVIACDNPARLSEFWAAALGYVEQSPPPGFASWEAFADEIGIPSERRNDFGAVVDPDGVGPRILFERYDGGAPNQRVHIDVNAVGGGGVELDPEQREQALDLQRRRLEELGASFKRHASGLAGEVWIEMFDPEGNWFCVQ